MHETRLRNATRLAVFVAAVGFPLAAYSFPDAPFVFADGDLIVAEELNDNFQHVVDGLSSVEAGVVPIGVVVAWAGVPATVPQGWLLCDGAEYTNAAYPELSNAIGSAHGGDGATSFFVPDLRGRFVRGVDAGAGRDPDALSRQQPQTGSGNAGDAVGSVQPDEQRSHFHGTAINFPNNQPGPGVFGNGSAGVQSDAMFAAGSGSADVQMSGSFGGAETRPNNAAMHFIIRAE